MTIFFLPSHHDFLLLLLVFHWCCYTNVLYYTGHKNLCLFRNNSFPKSVGLMFHTGNLKEATVEGTTCQAGTTLGEMVGALNKNMCAESSTEWTTYSLRIFSPTF